MVNPFYAVFVKKETTTAPKWSPHGGSFFQRKTIDGYVCEPPTDRINTDVVYTEAGKSTLIFQSLEVLREQVPIDLNKYHFFSHLQVAKILSRNIEGDSFLIVPQCMEPVFF